MDEIIGKLPFFLAAIMALFAGFLGLANNKSQNFIYGSMVICILSFGVIGFLIKNFLFDMLRKNEALQAEENKEMDENPEKSDVKGSVIDLKVDESSSPDMNDIYGDGFTPLEVSKVIQKTIGKDDK